MRLFCQPVPTGASRYVLDRLCPRSLHTRRAFRGAKSRNGAVAQLGERVVRNDEVSGSIPLSSTTHSYLIDIE